MDEKFGSVPSGRELVVVRHGERIDFTFNPDNDNWIKKAFDANGIYTRFDINMPRCLPKRLDGFHQYMMDSPLTEIGYLQAKITGRAMRDSNFKFSHIYCSPAYRCVQTCVGLLKGLGGTDVSIRIEPGLFEWGRWFRPKFPSWMQPQEFVSLGYPVELNYVAICPREKMSVDETLNQYYDRSHLISRTILDRHRHQGGNVLLVAHGASLETCSRQLCGEEIPTQNDFYRILHATPYLANMRLKEIGLEGRWLRSGSAVLPLQHSSNPAYNHKVHQLNVG